MTQTSPPQEKSLLPKELVVKLWGRVDRRLQRGDVLITTEHFQKVMEREFRKLVRVSPPRKIKEYLRDMIVAVNESHPETYLTLGIKNAVTRYFRDAQNRMQGQSLEDQNQSLQMIIQMVKGGRTAFFLESIGVGSGREGGFSQDRRSH